MALDWFSKVSRLPLRSLRADAASDRGKTDINVQWCLYSGKGTAGLGPETTQTGEGWVQGKKYYYTKPIPEPRSPIPESVEEDPLGGTLMRLLDFTIASCKGGRHKNEGGGWEGK